MKNRLLYSALFIFFATLLLSFVAKSNVANNHLQISNLEVEECYIPLFFATDDNNNPYDYDVLDDYFVGRLSAHYSHHLLKYLLPLYLFIIHISKECTCRSFIVVDNILLSWYATSHSRAPTC